ncbi:hypothetical protein MC7420_5187, partial [Coleofasciculus chthonoplastes PCC 7420]
PSSPNPFSHRGEKGDRMLLLPSPRRGRGAGGEGLSLS